MKSLILLFLFSSHLIAKEINEYECIAQSDLKLEISLTDSKQPTISLEKKNIKIARCFYQTLPNTKPFNKLSISADTVWNLQLLRCESYNEKFKDQFKYSEIASFKQAKSTALSYLRIFKDQQPTECTPR